MFMMLTLLLLLLLLLLREFCRYLLASIAAAEVKGE